MTGSFLQPSWAVFGWSAARYDRELSDMRGVGIRSVIVQWTVDMDSNWFSAMSAALAGTRTALWQDADMYASPSGPMDPARLQADLKATCGAVAARTGFSFTTQMSPASLGTSYYYDAYKAYASST